MDKLNEDSLWLDLEHRAIDTGSIDATVRLVAALRRYRALSPQASREILTYIGADRKGDIEYAI
jgi:hypothetical protein